MYDIKIILILICNIQFKIVKIANFQYNYYTLILI